ncbi:hypothetical protein HYX10_04140 [Candidatus Woesearchaeota archaeon]|nr:hypothetical protein [Candidatus Woesearchaeota archaeon]
MSEKITEDVKKLVVFRLGTLPPGKKISIGSSGEFSKDELVTHVNKGDEIGRKIIEVELEFLRAMKEGSLYE